MRNVTNNNVRPHGLAKLGEQVETLELLRKEVVRWKADAQDLFELAESNWDEAKVAESIGSLERDLTELGKLLNPKETGDIQLTWADRLYGFVRSAGVVTAMEAGRCAGKYDNESEEGNSKA